jgi:hypothetical protein
VNQAQANQLVAAAMWSSIPSAAMQVKAASSLAEEVNGSNLYPESGSLSGASRHAKDSDEQAVGHHLRCRRIGAGCAQKARKQAGPNSCNGSGVFMVVDNFAENAAIVHPWMIINGRSTA